MIITGLLQLIIDGLDILLAFSIPKLPAEFMEYLDTFFQYICTGAGLLANYVPFTYLLILFGIILTIDGAMCIYKFVMWVVRKIPVISIS